MRYSWFLAAITAASALGAHAETVIEPKSSNLEQVHAECRASADDRVRGAAQAALERGATDLYFQWQDEEGDHLGNAQQFREAYVARCVRDTLNPPDDTAGTAA